jgi:nitrogen fixation NifU-like protein
MYTEKVMDHFANPRNAGVIEDADGVGEVGNPVCGDMMTFYIKVKDDTLVDVKFQTFGCVAAIAVSSMVSEMAKGKKIGEVRGITNNLVAEALGGLPKNKLHCSNLGADALHKAIENYTARQGGRPGKSKAEAAAAVAESCCCPYCEGPLEGGEGICQTCNVELEECPECHMATSAQEEACAHCGSKLH